MLTLVHIKKATTSSATTASLTADYLAFDRRRTSRRQYQKAFGGMAIVVLLGAIFGRVPAGEAAIVAGLLLTVPLVLAMIEVVHWYHLVRRLDQAREDVRKIRKS